MSGNRTVHLVGGSYDGATITVPANWGRLDLIPKETADLPPLEDLLADQRRESYAPVSADDSRRNIWRLSAPTTNKEDGI